MGRARIVDVDYYQFVAALGAATGSRRIEPTDKKGWKSYVRENKVLEASCLAYARARSEKLKSVIILDGAWAGYYVYSPVEEFSMKFESGAAPEPAAAAGDGGESAPAAEPAAAEEDAAPAPADGGAAEAVAEEAPAASADAGAEAPSGEGAEGAEAAEETDTKDA